MTDKKDRSFNEQAYVIWDHFVRTGKSRKPGSDLAKGQSGKSQLTLHKIDGNYEPANFISKTLNKKNKLDTYKSLLDLETHKISSLVPEVRLSKIKGDKYTPFYFPVASENTTMTSMLQPGSSIGGSGIKSFDVKFVGKDFFTRDKTIQCSLSIFVDSLENIFRDPPTGYAPLAELFTISRKRQVPLREGFSKEVSSDQINKATSHEIVANLGYSVDRSSNTFTNRERQAKKYTDMLQADGKVHRLTVKQRDFEDFAEYFKETEDEPTEEAKTTTQSPPEPTATPTNSGPTSAAPDTSVPAKKSRSLLMMLLVRLPMMLIF